MSKKLAATVSADADLHSAYGNFQRSAEDAERMLRLAAGLADIRINRMRADFKNTLGAALKVPKSERALLERAEGPEAWIIIKPKAQLRRDMFGEEALAPLVRQAIVVIAAAVETFVADCAVATLKRRLQGSVMPDFAVEAMAKRIQRDASARPQRIKEVFRMAGVADVVGAATAVAGSTVMDPLSRLADARNKIAHGGAPADLTREVAMDLLTSARAAVAAIDAALQNETV